MEINVFQAALLGLFACLASMPGMGGSAIGNYTLGRPLVGGLVCGLILGDVRTGILVGAAMQLLYIALVTPGGTVSADVRAVSYIGIPLAMLALKSYGMDAANADGIGLATSFGAMDEGNFKKLYLVDMGLPWISHIICSFLPTFIICMVGADMVNLIKEVLPMDGIPMKTIFTVGSLLPCVGIAILLKQIITKAVDFIPFFVGFALAAALGINLVVTTIIAAMFAYINYQIQISKIGRVVAVSGDEDDDEEDI